MVTTSNFYNRIENETCAAEKDQNSTLIAPKPFLKINMQIALIKTKLGLEESYL